MRNLVRNVVSGFLDRYGLQLRRKHETDAVICAIPFATVIDGGANVGGYAAKLHAAMPNAEIHSFEPTPALFKKLQVRFAGDSKVVCHEQALSDKSGEVTFHVTDDPYSSSLLDQIEPGTTAKSITVKAVALDDWANGRTLARPALLKLDVEGNELAALRGASNLLSQIDYVELETTFAKMREGQPTFRDLVNFLDECGFDLLDVFPGMMDATTHLSTWADAVFVSRNRVD